MQQKDLEGKREVECLLPSLTYLQVHSYFFHGIKLRTRETQINKGNTLRSNQVKFQVKEGEINLRKLK